MPLFFDAIFIYFTMPLLSFFLRHFLFHLAAAITLSSSLFIYFHYCFPPPFCRAAIIISFIAAIGCWLCWYHDSWCLSFIISSLFLIFIASIFIDYFHILIDLILLCFFLRLRLCFSFSHYDWLLIDCFRLYFFHWLFSFLFRFAAIYAIFSISLFAIHYYAAIVISPPFLSQNHFRQAAFLLHSSLIYFLRHLRWLFSCFRHIFIRQLISSVIDTLYI